MKLPNLFLTQFFEMRLSLITLAALLLVSPSMYADDAPPVDLLARTGVRWETPDNVTNQANLAKLADGEASTVAVFSTNESKLVSVVFHLGPTVVSPNQLRIALPTNGTNDDSRPLRVEVMSSTLSDAAGYQSLKVFSIAEEKTSLVYDLPPSAARWLMLRFAAGEDEKSISIADIELSGGIGLPASRYAFQDSPVAALKVLAGLEASTKLAPTESAMLTDGSDGKFSEHDLATAALIASGAIEPAAQKVYTAKLAELTAKARTAINDRVDEENDFERGRELLGWMHAKVLTGGYVEQQTDLTTLLDTGKFNCVSATCLYAVLGRRLGLDVRAIEAPDHAFAILYDGARHVDVETTNRFGFNPGASAEARRLLREQTGFDYVPGEQKGKRRELKEGGIVAIVYYNHGVTHTRVENYHGALGSYFRALTLDREFDSAIKNTLAVFAKWSGKLREESKFEQAVEVVNAGLRLAPDDPSLKAYQQAIWTTYAKEKADAGKYAESVAVLKRAAKEFTSDTEKGNYTEMQSWVYMAPGEAMLKEDNWAAAVKLANEGIAIVDDVPQKQLSDWRTSLWLRWSYALIQDENFADAAKVMKAAIAVEKSDARLHERHSYIVQEWCWGIIQENGPAASLKVLEDLTTGYLENETIAESASNFIFRGAHYLVKDEQFEAAANFVQAGGKYIEGHADTPQLLRYVFDSWAQPLLDAEQFAAAFEVYQQARKLRPDDKHLATNWRATLDRLSSHHATKLQWDEIAAAYDKAIASAPTDNGLKKNQAYYMLQASQAKGGTDGLEQLAAQYERYQSVQLSQAIDFYVEKETRNAITAKEFELAGKLLLLGKSKVTDAETLRPLTRYLCDTWSNTKSGEGDVIAATKAYECGLTMFPKDKHVRHNAAVAWDKRARARFNAGDLQGAVLLYAESSRRFPESETLKKNFEIVKRRVEN